MPSELECKIRTESHAVVREKLTALEATYIGRVLEENRIFDREDGSLRHAGCGLRVRSIQVLDGKGTGPSLTYKGPKTPSAFKLREEIEVEIDDAERMAELLQALGFSPRVVYEKRRESWQWGGCRVELDELPSVGTFVEVEGPEESAIRTAMQALGLAELDIVTESYVSMAAAHGVVGDASSSVLRF